jgi:hypothetical protein
MCPARLIREADDPLSGDRLHKAAIGYLATV